jgi:hypothetical protein
MTLEIKIEKTLCTTPCIKNCCIWFKLKLVALLQTSEFPLEIPRSQNRNFPYKTTLYLISIDFWNFQYTLSNFQEFLMENIEGFDLGILGLKLND